MTRKPSDLPLYPLFLAAHFPLDLMTRNLATADVQAVLRPALVCVLAALLIMSLFGAALRDIDRAALCTALAVILVCYFKRLDPFFDQIASRLVGFMPPPIYVLAILLAIAATVGLVARPGPNATRIANVAAAVMLAFPVTTLAWREVTADDAAARSVAEMQRKTLFGAARAAKPPNIVHVVLDGYSRQDVLAAFYDFDNTPFLDRLRQLGFAIADKATTPYNQTLLVMTSVFSADYLDALVPPSSHSRLRQTLQTELQHNPVMETLSRLGYQTAAFDVRYDPARMEQVDHLLAPYRVGNFEMNLLEESLVHNVARMTGLVQPSIARDIFVTPYERGLASPFFLYLHALAPHPPFDVNRHGDLVEPKGGWQGLHDGSHFTKGSPQLRRIYRDGYIEKLMFANEMVLSYVMRIMEQVPDPKLILIHGDHGGGLYFDQNSLDRTCVTERFSPLLAVYASDGQLQRALPSDLNLVNLYRLIFKIYFGTDLSLLPSRSVFADWDEPTQQQALTPEQIARKCDLSTEVLAVTQDQKPE